MQGSICDEDKVEEAVGAIVANGSGFVVDFHTIDVFPTSWFDKVYVLRVETNVLWDRLEKRGYEQAKIKENVECEIFQQILEEVREHYENSGMQPVELASNTEAQMDANLAEIKSFIGKFEADVAEVGAP